MTPPKNGNKILGGLVILGGLGTLKMSQSNEEMTEKEKLATMLIGAGFVLCGIGLFVLPTDSKLNGGGHNGEDEPYEPFEPDGGGDEVEPAEAVIADEDVLPAGDGIEGAADNADEELAVLVEDAQALR